MKDNLYDSMIPIYPNSDVLRNICYKYLGEKVIRKPLFYSVRVIKEYTYPT